MSTGQDTQISAPATSRRRVGRAVAAMLGAVSLAAVLVAVALAASGSFIVSAASNSKLKEKIVVSSQGRTLYELSPETTSHLLCKSTTCLKNWPPLTVSSRKAKLKAGPGVKGKLGTLHRSNGTLQVTLNGMPLYMFKGDSTKGQANGQGLKGFGGTWHVVRS